MENQPSLKFSPFQKIEFFSEKKKKDSKKLVNYNDIRNAIYKKTKKYISNFIIDTCLEQLKSKQMKVLKDGNYLYSESVVEKIIQLLELKKVKENKKNKNEVLEKEYLLYYKLIKDIEKQKYIKNKNEKVFEKELFAAYQEKERQKRIAKYLSSQK